MARIDGEDENTMFGRLMLQTRRINTRAAELFEALAADSPAAGIHELSLMQSMAIYRWKLEQVQEVERRLFPAIPRDATPEESRDAFDAFRANSKQIDRLLKQMNEYERGFMRASTMLYQAQQYREKQAKWLAKHPPKPAVAEQAKPAPKESKAVTEKRLPFVHTLPPEPDKAGSRRPGRLVDRRRKS